MAEGVWNPAEPFNALPPLPPKGEIETRAVLKAVTAARTALAELNGEAKRLPNQRMLVRSLLLQEARLSSEIENIVTTNDRLYQALSRDAWEDHPNLKEVLRYSEALWHGMDALKRRGILNATLFVELVGIVKGIDLGIRTHPGTVIWDYKLDQPRYTPPEGEPRLRALLDNLTEFLMAPSDLDPLVRMAVGHYQFEAIHPFPDGNGRVGRVVNLLYIVQQGLLETPILYLSRQILARKSEYLEGLRDVTARGAWEAWILFMLEAVTETARDTRARIQGILTVMADVSERVRNEVPRVYSRELIEVVFSQPFTRISHLVEAGVAGRQTASRYLQELERLGILRRVSYGRDKLYENRPLMALLSA